MDASGTAATQGRRIAGHRRAVLVIAVVAAAVAFGGVITYLVIGLVAYDELSRLRPDAAGRWPGQTPANFEVRRDGGTGAPWLDAAPYRFDDYTEVAFQSRDPRPLTIRAWWAPGPAGPAGPVVIVVHGREAARRDPVVLLPAGMLHRAGFGVLMPDLRDHGASDVEDMRWAGGAEEYRDVLGAVDWLLTQGYAPERIGLAGTSLGGATVTIAMGAEPRVAATWADCTFSEFDVAAREYTEDGGYPGWVTAAGVLVGRLISGDPLGEVDPADALARLDGRPYAIVHGDADATVRVHHAWDNAAIATANGTPVTPWIVAGAGHAESMMREPETYDARIVAFFREALGAPEG